MIVTRFAAIVLACAGFAAAAEAFPGDTVVLQGIDKVTARVWTFEAPIERVVRFGSLQIVAHACDRTPPEEPPESTAFLEIHDIHRSDPSQSLFSGWMFASSPGLNGLEHPVYDVWLLECKNAKPQGGR